MLAGSAAAQPAGRLRVPCPPTLIADQVTSLFPPTAPVERREAAQWLGRCRDTRTAGVLETALAHDPDLGVRVGAARALGTLGTTEARDMLRAALTAGAPPDLRPAVVAAVADLGDTTA